jgi:hypothetical protein
MTGIREQRFAVVKRILRLFDNEELTALCNSLGINDGSDLNVLIKALADLPRYRALQLSLRAAAPTVTMLQDITSFLEQHRVAARTTGFVLALADPARPGSFNKLDLSAQEVSEVCSFCPKTLKRLGDEPFTEAYDDWQSLRDSWIALIRKSRPVINRGRLDVVRSAIERQTVYEPDEDHTDYKAQGVLKHLLDRAKQLLDILERIDKQDRSPVVDHLRDDINSVIRRANIEVFQRTQSYKLSRFGKPDEVDMLRYVSNEFLDKFDGLNEDLRAIADLSESASILDILRVDLWSARPQLYEVWLLVCITSWITSRGYQTRPLTLEQGNTGRFLWHLSYSRSSQPCFEVGNGEKDTFIFFQLYRPSGDMPDLCLLSDSSPNATPVWAIDAKHSEKSGYSVGSYRETATRYRDSFGAPLSLVVEYFPRVDISKEELIEFGGGAALVKDVRPNGHGTAVLFNLLSDLYPLVGKSVLCVDYSSSFRPKRNQAFESVFEAIRNTEPDIVDLFVCFSGEAIIQSGMRDILFSARTECRFILLGQ